MLEEAGMEVTSVPAYQTVIAHDPAFAGKVRGVDTVTFTSASTVRGSRRYCTDNRRVAAREMRGVHRPGHRRGGATDRRARRRDCDALHRLRDCVEALRSALRRRRMTWFLGRRLAAARRTGRAAR